MAKKIMIQGTGSGKGKSLTVCILCRLLSNEGYKVAPLKSVNFTAVTYKLGDGMEFGYSQALQAVAARAELNPDFNPITPKPWVDGTISVFIRGRKVVDKVRFTGEDLLLPKNDPVTQMFRVEALEGIVREVLAELESRYDVIVIEGSGPIKVKGLGAMSKAVEFANMHVARIANAPVLMIANTPDSAKGMLSMLSEEELNRIKGLIVNPFDAFKIAMDIGAKLSPELAWSYGKAVYGDLGKDIVAVLPYIEELAGMPELDPVQPAPTIPLDLWDTLIERIANNVKDYIDMNKVHAIMGL